MKLRYFFIGLLILIGGCSIQKLPESNPEFSVSPLLFLKSDHSVVKNYNVDLEIRTNERATYHVRKVTHVMGNDARDMGELILPYGGFQEIVSVEGAIYSSSGKLLRRLAKGDAKDVSLSSGYTLYEDTRIKIYELYHDEYPYTVVYDYKIELNGLLSLPTFYPQNRNQYVESARLNVKIPQELNLQYRELESENSASKSVIGQDSVFNWQYKELAPLKSEPYGRSFSEVTPKVLLALESFKMGKSEGRLDSWDNFGEWYYKLAEGRNELPENVKKDVTNIYGSASSKREGIRDLYEYMQNKTRYVSIQLGIGGWQPFDARFVEEKGYGDCKALTNYMQAILNYVGVEAYPVLVKNGISEADIVTDFPSNQFNHVILWVPEADTIWLESTSQTIPFNYIGYSNSDRHGLAITPDSSFLVKTPIYDYHINKLSNKTHLKLDRQGDVEMNIRSSYSGYYLDELLSNIAKKSNKDRQRWFHEQFALNFFKIKSADFSGIDTRQNEPVLYMEIENSKYATKTGNRLFIPANKLNRLEKKLPIPNEDRTEPVNFTYSFQERDSSVIELPEGFRVEAAPDSIRISTDFGLYSLNVRDLDKDRIAIERAIILKEKRLPPERYQDLVDFFAQVKSNDRKNIVLIEE